MSQLGKGSAPRLASGRSWLRAPSAEKEGSISDGSYLVDPASSHMLVSKIKPCMS
ncbi:hypothetical protein T484DRAFT_1618414 [Baffinella frigidus]|nr:hypothetical protein T484DRAFT_1618414 [Cryptophyta sp. CCMP2293]